MVRSSTPCLKCGKYEVWRVGIYLNPSRKSVTVVSRCDHCDRYFKKTKILIMLSKLKKKKEESD